MGGGNSKEAAESKAIEKEMRRQQEEDESKVKLLLLGAGESGKSTVFKQMKVLYGKPMTEDEARHVSPVVHNNIVGMMKTMSDQIEAFGRTSDLSADAQAAHTIMTAMGEDDPLEESHAKPIMDLWNDSVFQEVWDRRAEFQVIESTKAFLPDIDRICKAGFLATEADLLLTRIRTSGIVEEKYDIDGVTFEMYDVGGQRNERKKWIHCFEGVTAVIFVVGLSEYDQRLYEDASENRMIEALDLFKDIINNPYFKDSSMLLFLNKKDLFQSKIQRVGIKETFEKHYLEKYPGGNTYDGPPNDYDAGCQYFLGEFQGQIADPNKAVYSHVTCATDTNNVKVVFEACKETILKANLADSGFSF